MLSKDRTFLGNILFQYVDHEEIFMKSLVNDPKLLQKFFMQMAEEQGKKPRECEKQPPYIVTKAGVLLYCALLKCEEHYYFLCPCGD